MFAALRRPVPLRTLPDLARYSEPLARESGVEIFPNTTNIAGLILALITLLPLKAQTKRVLKTARTWLRVILPLCEWLYELLLSLMQ